MSRPLPVAAVLGPVSLSHPVPCCLGGLPGRGGTDFLWGPVERAEVVIFGWLRGFPPVSGVGFQTLWEKHEARGGS